MDDFSHDVRDVIKHIHEVAADNTGIPIFMFGHSMVSEMQGGSPSELRVNFDEGGKSEWPEKNPRSNVEID